MSHTLAPSLAFTPRLAFGGGKLALARIVNFYDLLGAYGPAFYHDATPLIRRQLIKLGSPAPEVLLNGPYIFIDFKPCHGFEFHNEDALCEHINSLLTFSPFICGNDEVFLSVETTFIDRKNGPKLTNDSYAPSAKSHILAAGSEREKEKLQRAYKADMAHAVSLFSQLSTQTLVLAFQPVVSIGNNNSIIYWEALLRRKTDSSSSGFSPCAPHIAALERLGIVGRLDRSVIWTLLDLLTDREELQLGCNISAQSLKFDCWWRVLFNALQEQPSAASRLIIEVTETSAITEDEEALTLLRTLKILGCKIAIDDMGSGYSTLDFVVRSRPDFVKIDKAYLPSAATVRFETPRSLFRNLVQLCAGIAPCVITEGIESDRDRSEAINAGSHGLQGYLFGLPSVLPPWLSEPTIVRDAFAPKHPSHFQPTPAHSSGENRTDFLNPLHGF